jgi:predicted nucleic acid-binding protein
VLQRPDPASGPASGVAARRADALARLGLSLLTLPASRHVGLVSAPGRADLRGGAVYDAVVGATALHHGLALLPVDRRARTTYESIGAACEFVA